MSARGSTLRHSENSGGKSTWTTWPFSPTATEGLPVGIGEHVVGDLEVRLRPDPVAREDPGDLLGSIVLLGDYQSQGIRLLPAGVSEAER